MGMLGDGRPETGVGSGELETRKCHWSFVTGKVQDQTGRQPNIDYIQKVS